MVVKTDHGEFEVAPLSFKDRRKMHGIEIASIKNGEVDFKTFYHVLKHFKTIYKYFLLW